MDNQYNYIADKYDTFMNATPFRPYIEAYTFFNVLGDVTDLSILDLATGTGYYARAVAKMNAAKVVGIDLSEEMIALARHAEQDDPLGIVYHVADVAQFESPTSFDLGIAVYLLHYAPTQEALQTMCHQIAANLASGARFVAYQLNPNISDQSGYYEKYGLFMKTKPMYKNGERIAVQLNLGGEFTPEIVFYRWDKETIDASLRTAGFTTIRWVDPMLSADWDETKGEKNFFDNYLAIPHALIIECTKT